MLIPAVEHVDSLQRGADWAQIAAAALGPLGLVLVWLGVLAARRQIRSERTSQILDRYGKTDFLLTWKDIMQFLTASNEPACIEQIRIFEAASPSQNLLSPSQREKDFSREPKATRMDIQSTVYFYEQIGAMFNRGEIDRGLAMRSFAPVMVQALEASWWWINFERDGKCIAVEPQFVRGHETEIDAEWERMVRTVVRKRRDLRAETKINPEGLRDHVRALCLPLRAEPSEEDWERCKSLSGALGDALRAGRLDDLRRALEVVPTGRLEAGERSYPKAEQTPATGRSMLIPRWRDSVTAPPGVIRLIAGMGARLCGREVRGDPSGGAPRKPLNGATAKPSIDRVPRPAWLRGLGNVLTHADARVVVNERHRLVAELLGRRRQDHGDEAVLVLVTNLLGTRSGNA